MTYQQLENIQLKHSGKVCIWGTGLIGRTWGYDVLKAADFKIDYYYDNKLSAGVEVHNGISTVDFVDLCNLKENLLVFVAVTEKYHSEIQEQLQLAGIRNYFMLGYIFLQEFCESVLISQNEGIIEKYRDVVDDGEFLKKQFFYRVGYELNLENPRTFNEKLQWLKLNDRKPEYTKLVDKYEFKKYIVDLLGEEYIIPTLGVWDCVEDIEWEKLPNQFVIKCTHDSGSVIVCRDKTQFDMDVTRKKFNNALKLNFYWNQREWPYKNVKPRIIAEEYMQNGEQKELRDYKFYCFGGLPRFLYVSEGLENHNTARISFIDIENGNWRFAPFKRTDYKEFERLPKKPDCLDEMVQIAKKLSSEYSFVRVDLYEIKNQVYISEMTFTPGAGGTIIEPAEWEMKLGEWIELPQC